MNRETREDKFLFLFAGGLPIHEIARQLGVSPGLPYFWARRNRDFRGKWAVLRYVRRGRLRAKQAKFLEHLHEGAGVHEACRLVGIAPQSADDWRKRSPAFSKLVRSHLDEVAGRKRQVYLTALRRGARVKDALRLAHLGDYLLRKWRRDDHFERAERKARVEGRAARAARRRQRAEEGIA